MTEGKRHKYEKQKEELEWNKYVISDLTIF
jgi:hypothetical protein